MAAKHMSSAMEFACLSALAPLKPVEKHEYNRDTLKLLGQVHYCSSDLMRGIEVLLCAIYGQPRYDDINTHRYERVASF